MRGLNGKKVVVTGAARGIGRATAQRFLEEGATVLLCDLDENGGDWVQEDLRSRATYMQTDVTRVADVFKIEDWAKKNGLDVLVNNAGITRDASIGKLDEEAWAKVIDVNLTAVFRLCQMAARVMKEQGRGVILNAASVVAHYGNFGQANYVASKAGVIGLTKTLAKELGRSGVRVNAVAPGFIATDMTAKVPDKVLATMREKTPLQRLGDPSDIAAAYAFLASDDGAYISGTVLNVDGGLVLG
jgi:3-oxoacyl-[acyl-carrier protein] reductase